MAVERTLVLIKPDAMQRQLAGEILARFERRGLAVREAKLVTVDRELAERHYAEHSEKPFFDSVDVEPDPERALDRADRPVLVTGSLYLIADLNVRLQRIPWENSARS